MKSGIWFPMPFVPDYFQEEGSLPTVAQVNLPLMAIM
jgi:hypothetical protein